MEKKFNKLNRPSRYLLIILGWFFVILGVLGIFLPLLPTTVFLVIAASLFARSSEKFYNKLLNNKYLGSYIRNFRDHRGMTLKSKITAIITMNLAIGYSAFFAVETMWIRIMLIILALSLNIFFISIKTVPNVQSE